MKDVSYELFFKRFWMYVEERAFYSDEALELVGVMGVNSQEELESVLSRYRQVKVTPVELAGYYANGYKLKFVDLDDAPIIYDLINTHLNNWLIIASRLGYVSSIPPIEDFELLDNLAELLFPYRKITTVFSRIFETSGPFSRTKEMFKNQGVYERFSPKLFKYCAEVYGDI